MISWTTIKVRGGRVNVGWMKVICKLIVYELSYYFHCIVYSWLSPFVPTPLPFPCPRLKVSLNVWYYNRLVHHLASPSDKAKHFQPWKRWRQDAYANYANYAKIPIGKDQKPTNSIALQILSQRQTNDNFSLIANASRANANANAKLRQLRQNNSDLRQVIEVWLKRDRVSATF